MANNNAQPESKKVAFLNGNSVVLPIGLLSVIVIGMANLAISYSNGISDDVREETMQDAAISALKDDIKDMKTDVKILERHQADIEIALKTAKLME